VSLSAASAPQGAASVAVPGLRWTGAEAPAPLFPTSGLVLLLVLLAAAAMAWWFGPRGPLGPLRRPGGSKFGWAALRGSAGMATPVDGIDVVCASRLDAQHRLYVVRWAGGELLLGVNAQSAPVVLDRRVPSSPPAGEPS
jgi:hypothetical protein